jgi:Zn-dependent protease
MRRRGVDEYTIVEPNYSYSWTLSTGDGLSRSRKDAFFSRTELIHITLAILVLVPALTLVLWDFSYSSLSMTLILAAAAVLLGFLGHEMAHKIIARRYGCWAEFRANFRGLGIALIISLFGILFAAPGAVYILGNISKSENAKISIPFPPLDGSKIWRWNLPLYILVTAASGLMLVLTLDWIF